jgi:hypothetical protein
MPNREFLHLHIVDMQLVSRTEDEKEMKTDSRCAMAINTVANES